jgi:glycosyltransferase involved in cell wall biosynthesis
MKPAMKLLYLYPEEWTGRRAREVHTLSTCAALAGCGIEVTLLTAGGLPRLREHLVEIAGASDVPCLRLAALSRSLGPLRSAAIFRHRFHRWHRDQPRFDWAYIIHLKAAGMLVDEHVMPYAYEAHEIFAQTPQKNQARQSRLHELERRTLSGAALRIATSAPLAAALSAWFALPDDFAVVPNAGLAPLDRPLAAPHGPFVYCGSIADWKGLDLVIHAAQEARVPLKIIGGTKEEWRKLAGETDTSEITWQPRVPLHELSQALSGARAGLIPTQPETPSGRYSCPMKLFDYARCGLPVISTALPSLKSLAVGSWCRQVPEPTQSAWTQALKAFHHDPSDSQAALAWAANHTWTRRAELLHALLMKATP